MLVLCVAGCASAPLSPSIVGLWRAQEIAGSPVPSDARITLSLYADGRAVGRAGCNNYTTTYKQTGDGIAFAPVISTKMACAQDVMALEQSYLDALVATTHAARQADDTLALTSDAGARIMFRREEAASLQDARARGIDFRAAGQEPAWIVELKLGDHITAMLDYGSTSLVLPAPSGEAEADGTEVYNATTDTDHLVLSIKSKICLDAMSGEPHPSTVELTVNDKAYRGCGDWLD
ncbi:MAG TPA: META domain-containing protein [Dongiaceae bacterium]